MEIKNVSIPLKVPHYQPSQAGAAIVKVLYVKICSSKASSVVTKYLPYSYAGVYLPVHEVFTEWKLHKEGHLCQA